MMIADDDSQTSIVPIWERNPKSECMHIDLTREECEGVKFHGEGVINWRSLALHELSR